MAVYDSRLVSIEGGIDPSGVRRYVRVYQVRAYQNTGEPKLDNDADDIDDQVAFVLYDPYPTDAFAYLKQKDVQQTPELFVWTLTLTWDSESNPSDQGTTEPGEVGVAPTTPGTNSPATPPAQRPWVVKWGAIQTERILETDVSEDEKPVANSAGQPFDPPVKVPCSDVTLSITCFSARINAANTWLYFNKVNKFKFLGLWPPGWARCTRYEQTSLFEGGQTLWQTDITIQFREDGWNPIRVLDAGTVELSDPDGTGQRLRAIVDETGAAVTSPVPLDGFGEKLAAGEDLVYLEFQGYYEADFKGMFP